MAAERATEREVLLKDRLRATLLRLNDGLTGAQADRVIFDLERADGLGMARNRLVHEYLTYGTPLTVDGLDGRDTRTVRFFDFDDPVGGLNEFVVTTQFRVLRGNEKGDLNDDQRVVIPDLVLFVNGIPLVVMEAKSPTWMEVWKTQAVRQLRRYQEAEPQWSGAGAPALFHYNLLCVAHCGAAAAFSSLYAPETCTPSGSRCCRTRSRRLETGSAKSPRARPSSSWACCRRRLCWTSCATTWSMNWTAGR